MTTAVVTRIHLGELPYIKSFINHYINLNVDHFYFLNTKIDEEKAINVYLEDYTNITIRNISSNNRKISGSQTELLTFIKEDYILNVDCDEYLLLDYNNFKHLYEKNPSDYYIFRWTMVINDTLQAPKLPYSSHFYGSKKYLVKRKYVKILFDHHAVVIKDIKKKQLPKFIHFWSRSFLDVVLKCILQRFNDPKYSNYKQILQMLKLKNNIPNRLKVLAKQKLLNIHNLDWNNIPILKIDSKLEKEIVNVYLNDNQIKELKYLYNLFKSQVNKYKIDNSIMKQAEQLQKIKIKYI